MRGTDRTIGQPDTFRDKAEGMSGGARTTVEARLSYMSGFGNGWRVPVAFLRPLRRVTISCSSR